MSHRKFHSQGCVPFSWEEKPGLPKFNHQKSSIDIGLTTLHILSDTNSKNIPVPPPPYSASQPPRRSHSVKGMRWQDDPFLAALKACTKSVIRNHSGGHKGDQIKGNGNYSKSVFSCKQSCDVENDNFVRFSKLPPLPRERYKAKPFVKNSQ